METASGLKFILNTDNETSQGEVRELVRCGILMAVTCMVPRTLYATVYVEFAAKNPMSVPGEMITSNLFRTKVDEFIRASMVFKSSGSNPSKNIA